MKMEIKKRCFGNKPHQILLAEYHDKEWGVPVHNDQKLFEMLVLECSQAGLNWETILKRRKSYKKAFYNFNIAKVASMSDQDLENLIEKSKIIRNRLKIYATRQNAKVFLEVRKEFGTFNKYLWSFVNFEPIKNSIKNFENIPQTSSVSDAISKDLKKRGMSFVGSKIVYAYMQAIGMVNDHIETCWIIEGNT